MQDIVNKAGQESKSLDADICQPKVFQAAREVHRCEPVEHLWQLRRLRREQGFSRPTLRLL